MTPNNLPEVVKLGHDNDSFLCSAEGIVVMTVAHRDTGK